MFVCDELETWERVQSLSTWPSANQALRIMADNGVWLVKDYLKKVDLKSSKVICHVLMFQNAIKSFCFRNKRSKSNFSQVLWENGENSCSTWNTVVWTHSRNGTWSFAIARGAGGDEEKNGCVKLVREYLRPRETLTCIWVLFMLVMKTSTVMSDGVLKWRCSLCCNLLSSEQRIISHLITTHGKEDLEHGKKQNLQPRTTLWRRKRSADGSFIHEQCSSNFQDEVSPPT